ncbi:MAG: hypothetical protein ACQETL_00460 [Bacteroidota bacterium]
MKDRFTIWIKNIIDGGRIDPPDEAWSNISQNLDIEDSWQNIDKELDIDTVWNRLDHQLNEAAKMRTYEKISYVPIVALLLLLSWLGLKNEIYDEPINDNQPIAQNVISEDKADSNKTNTFNLEKPDNAQKPEIVKENSEKESENLDKKQELVKSIIKTTQKEKIQINNENKAELQPKNISSSDDITPELNKTSLKYLNSIPAVLNINFDSLNRRAPELITFSKDSVAEETDMMIWYYGIGLSANRTWLNDNRLKRASEGSSLYNAIASNNLSFKINASLNLNQNWAIQSDITVLGNIGQSYGEYINGKYKEGNINVNYNGLQIGLKRNLPSLFGTANLLNKQIIAGGYANHIYEVTQNENIFISNENNQLNISGLYKNWDFGIWGGIEMFYRLNGNYLLGTALHYKYGLNNIYKGDNEIPAYLRETNTSELSLSLILRRNSK